MASNPTRFAFYASLVLVLVASLTEARQGPLARDLASNANIYLYPKPHEVSNMTLRDASGRVVTLNDYRGKVVLLHFWSINCPACRAEEPSLQALKRRYGNQGLEILGVNLVDQPANIVRHAKASHCPFPVLFDSGKGFSLRTVSMSGRKTAFVLNPEQEAILEVPGLPTTYIIDCRGRAVGYSIGAAHWQNGSASRLLQSLLRDSASCDTGTRRYSRLW